MKSIRKGANSMAYERIYNIIGLSFLTILIVQLYFSVTTNNFSFIELLSWTALAYLSFSASHLYPLLKEINERAKRIKEKGMKISLYIVLFLFLLISTANFVD